MYNMTWSRIDTLEYYKGQMETYKTNPSKKAYLTRQRKQVEEVIIDYREAWDSRPDGAFYGRLQGDRVFERDIREQQMEIDIINNLRESLIPLPF